MKVDHHVAFPGAQIHQGPILPEAARASDLNPIHDDIQRGRVENGRSGADGGEHPAPVGVVAEDRTLEEIVAGNRPGDLEDIIFARRRADLDLDVVEGVITIYVSERPAR